jgi:hypothetical protein
MRRYLSPLIIVSEKDVVTVPLLLVVCQFVSYAMSLLYCQCQQHKYFGFSNVMFRIGSIVSRLSL